jgi:hypothetical protein
LNPKSKATCSGYLLTFVIKQKYVKISYQLNDASVTDASATPPTIGKRVATTHGVGFCRIIKRIVKNEST